MHTLIQAFCSNGGHLTFTSEDPIWRTYKDLTKEERDYLSFICFGFTEHKGKRISHYKEVIKEKRFLWFWKRLDKQQVPVYKEIVTVKMFPVPRKPTLEVL